MIDFKIDTKKCIQCGLCSSECPVMIIDGKSEFPKIKEGKEGQCIKCQHCLAVCPTGALSIWGKKPEDSVIVSDEIPSPEEMSLLIKTRRSIRKFKDEELGRELIHQLLDTSAYATTGHNKNAVQLSVIDNKVDLADFRNLVYDSIKKAADEDRLIPSMQVLLKLQTVWETKGIDVLFRNAPHLLIASAPEKATSPDTDSHIALSYFELLANTYGIGTLWNGMVKWVIKDIAPEIKELIGIPENHVIGYVMIFGKPAVKYARSIQNEGIPINRISLS